MSQLRRNSTPSSTEHAREFRKNMGRAEKRLWYDGLARKRLGFYFRRQYPLGPYFLDFFCTEVRVCVEVDGAQHEFSCEHDARRDRWLAENDILTLRFASDSVMLDLPRILWKIEEACKSRTPTLPSPSGEGEASCMGDSAECEAESEVENDKSGAFPSPEGERVHRGMRSGAPQVERVGVP